MTVVLDFQLHLKDCFMSYVLCLCFMSGKVGKLLDLGQSIEHIDFSYGMSFVYLCSTLLR